MVCAMGNSSTLVLLFNKDRITSVRSSSATVGGVSANGMDRLN